VVTTAASTDGQWQLPVYGIPSYNSINTTKNLHFGGGSNLYLSGDKDGKIYIGDDDDCNLHFCSDDNLHIGGSGNLYIGSKTTTISTSVLTTIPTLAAVAIPTLAMVISTSAA